MICSQYYGSLDHLQVLAEALLSKETKSAFSSPTKTKGIMEYKRGYK